MRVGTVILAMSGAAEERKSHAPMSAIIRSIDPNEAAKALKKFMASSLYSSAMVQAARSRCIVFSSAFESELTSQLSARNELPRTCSGFYLP